MLQTLASVEMENLPVVIRFLLQSVTAADALEVGDITLNCCTIYNYVKLMPVAQYSYYYYLMIILYILSCQ